MLPEDPRFAELLRRLRAMPTHGLRSVIVVEVDRVSDSCGFAVPLLDYVGDATLLTEWAAPQDRRGPGSRTASRTNAASIDGLPGARAVTLGSQLMSTCSR